MALHDLTKGKDDCQSTKADLSPGEFLTATPPRCSFGAVIPLVAEPNHGPCLATLDPERQVES
jgi:hypothetical protein